MFSADVYINEPLDKVMEDWDFLNEKVISKFLTFKPFGNNIYGLRTIRHDSATAVGSGNPLEMVKTRRNYEIGAKGKVIVPREPLCAHVTVSGTPHHTEHLFGYWHINDKDEIILPLPPASEGEPGHLLIIMGHPKESESDKINFYCDACEHLIFSRQLITGTAGFSKFWKFEKESIREYNSDPKHRTCSQCGHVNPYGYTAFHELDTPEEREARMKW